MEEVRREDKLGYDLKCRLAMFLANATNDVVPPGTIGAGMGVRQSDDVQHQYDPKTGILHIVGVTKIEVYRVQTD